MLHPEVWQGVETFLGAYVGVTPDDDVLLLYAPDSAQVAVWVSVGLEAMGIRPRRLAFTPLADETFAARLATALPSPDEVAHRLVVLTFERETMSHAKVIEAALAGHDPSRRAVFRAISSCDDFFTRAMRATPPELSARNTALLERLMTAQRLRITAPGGTDLAITLDNARHRWISNRGSARPGRSVILPAGEVATYPATVEGVLVADFAFNVNAITDQDSRLDRTPVTVRIEGGRAVETQCEDPRITRFLQDCFQTHCAYNVGELGLGTNPGIVEPIAMNSHINERRPGVHLGFGQHNQDPGVVGYQCAIHLDLIARGGLIWVDDDPLPLDLENLPPPRGVHPSRPRDEDVFAPDSGDDLTIDDCCGILTSEGLTLCPMPPQ